MENEKCCCCEKHTYRGEDNKKKLINRLRRIEGQVRGIQTMLENDAYCNDILCSRQPSAPPLMRLIKKFWRAIYIRA